MKKSFLAFMLIANLIPQETFGANSLRVTPRNYNFRLEAMENSLRDNAQTLMDNAFVRNYKHMPKTNTEYNQAHQTLSQCLEFAISEKFPLLSFPSERADVQALATQTQAKDYQNIKKTISDTVHFFLRAEPSERLREVFEGYKQEQALEERFHQRQAIDRAAAYGTTLFVASTACVSGVLLYKHFKS